MPYFVAVVLIQVLLAVHAYRTGRLYPWVWILLLFPVVGGLVYVVLFLLPRFSISSGKDEADRPLLREVPLGPFASRGEHPDRPIVVESVAQIEVRASREECSKCGEQLRVREQRVARIDERLLRIVITECGACGESPVRYFEVARAEDAPPDITH